MRFSIIVPVYNVEKYLERCISSVLNQSFSDYELLLVEDCSTDSSFEIAERFIGEKVKLYRNKVNSGLSVSRNVGVQNAIGEYILFLDSDDYVENDALFVLDNLISSNGNPDIVYTGVIEERGQEKTRKYGYKSESDKSYTRYEFLKSELEKRNLYAPAVLGVYKRMLIVDNNLFFKPGIYHEDELWTPQIVDKAKKIYLSKYIYYHYVKRENSITTKTDRTQNGLDLMDSCYDLIDIFKEMGESDLKKLMNNHIAMVYMKAMCKGRLYRAEYISKVDRVLPLRYASTYKDILKALIFALNLKLYYFLDQKWGDNEDARSM